MPEALTSDFVMEWLFPAVGITVLILAAGWASIKARRGEMSRDQSTDEILGLAAVACMLLALPFPEASAMIFPVVFFLFGLQSGRSWQRKEASPILGVKKWLGPKAS